MKNKVKQKAFNQLDELNLFVKTNTDDVELIKEVNEAISHTFAESKKVSLGQLKYNKMVAKMEGVLV